jgi:hypothetical protein
MPGWSEVDRHVCSPRASLTVQDHPATLVTTLPGAPARSPTASDGVAWKSGSRWRGTDVLRISVSNWSTDDLDVEMSLDALRRAAA